ncbi:hypothetical protein [Pseudomonas extremaustralis]
MSKLNKFISFLFLTFALIQPVYAKSAVKVGNITPFLNKHGVYANKVSTGGNDLQALTAMGLKLCIVVSVLIGLIILIKGAWQFRQSQTTGQVSNPRALIVGLLFSTLFVSIVPTMGLFSGLDCSNSNVYECAIWNSDTSGITGSLKEKIDNVMADNIKTQMEKHREKYFIVIGFFQVLGLVVFIRQGVLLYSWANGSSRDEKASAIIIVGLCAALVFDLPHTVITVSGLADMVVETFKNQN